MHTSSFIVFYSGSSTLIEPQGLRSLLLESGIGIVSEATFFGTGRTGSRWEVSGAEVTALRTLLAPTAAEFGALHHESGQLVGGSLAVIPAALVKAERKLLVMDVDSTLIKQEVIELLAAHAGREAEVAAVTEAAMRGELDFAQSLHARVQTLTGLPASVINEVRGSIELSDGARELVAAFKAAGHYVGVVSGGFQQVLDPLAAELGLDFALANDLGIRDGVLTGTVNGTVVDRAMKETKLREWAASLDIDMSHTIAVGDGANDLDMVGAAGLGVAFNAKPALRAAAGACIDLPRLDIIADLVSIA